MQHSTAQYVPHQPSIVSELSQKNKKNNKTKARNGRTVLSLVPNGERERGPPASGLSGTTGNGQRASGVGRRVESNESNELGGEPD